MYKIISVEICEISKFRSRSSHVLVSESKDRFGNAPALLKVWDPSGLTRFDYLRREPKIVIFLVSKHE